MFSFKTIKKRKNRALVMGILNITPDSFSDGGEAFTVDGALKKLKRLCDEGADIIDIGACSTAPVNGIISEKEELERLEFFLPEIIKNCDVPVSVDTFRASAVKFALDSGADIINDESGAFNPEIAKCVSEHDAGWIFMHTGGENSSSVARYPHGVTEDVAVFFRNMKEQALNFGVNEECICYDLGIGFGKTRNDDLKLLSEIESFSDFSPLLVGVSRKRIIGEITGVKDPKERVSGSVAAAVLCACKGADVLRVHDVKETVEAVKIGEAFKKGVL